MKSGPRLAFELGVKVQTGEISVVVDISLDARYVRQAPCDATGHFSFTGLPDGAWYVITVASPVGGGVKMAVMRRVETDGQTVRVVLR